MFLKIVSKKTVSLEKTNSPVLKVVEKSFLQEVVEIIAKQIIRVNR